MHFVIEHCQSLLNLHGNIYLALLSGALLGSVTHCAGMCGPLVAAQTTARLEKTPVRQLSEWHRLQGAALLPYHFGRLTTYILLGAVAGGFSSLLFTSPYLGWLASAMLAGAGILFLMQALGMRTTRNGRPATQTYLTRLTAPLWHNPTGARGYALGIMLGFLPCGLLWAALLAVATTGSAFAAALGMLIFGLGTLPALFAVGLGSHYLSRRWPEQTRIFSRGALGISGMFLCALAVRNVT